MKNPLTGKKIVYLELALVLALVYSLHNYNYLLFHSFAELVTVIVAFAVFIMAWNARDFFDNKILFFCAMALLPFAVFTSLHMFSYKGVSIFKDTDGANMATQLWLISRYFLSGAFLAAPFVAHRFKEKWHIFVGMLGAMAAILGLFFIFDFFPDAYIDGQGLTTFKIYSEYVIILMFGGALYGLYRKRSTFDSDVYAYLVLAIAATIISGFMFTLYFAVTDEFNLFGHLFNIVTFFFLYAGIVEINLMHPYRLMFKNLNDLNTAKNEFLSLASHQLKNPLSIILLSADIMESDASFATRFPQYHLYMRDISASVARMRKIIDTLINVTKIELGVAEVRDEDIETASFIRENIAGLEVLAKQKRLTIIDNIGDRTLPTIRSDRQLLGIVLENILSNAIKYSKPENRIEISVAENPVFSIRVKDFGYGIPEDEQHRILKDSFRGGNIAHLAHSGSGVGLYLVKKIADKIGIDVFFESKENEGTAFELKFKERRGSMLL